MRNISYKSIEYANKVKSRVLNLVEYLEDKFKSNNTPANVKHYIERLNEAVDIKSKDLVKSINAIYIELADVIKSLAKFVDTNYYKCISQGQFDYISVVKLYDDLFELASLATKINKEVRLGE